MATLEHLGIYPFQPPQYAHTICPEWLGRPSETWSQSFYHLLEAKCLTTEGKHPAAICSTYRSRSCPCMSDLFARLADCSVGHVSLGFSVDVHDDSDQA